MEGVIVVFGLIWSILSIILFFKVWGACNNIQRLADKYAPENVNKGEISRSSKATLETKEDIDKWLNGE